jgi:hypothetical protein
MAGHQRRRRPNLRAVEKEDLMGDKSPKKENKKQGKSLKEKRADKHAKKEEKRPGFGG